MTLLRFQSHTLKLKASDQPQSAGKESVFTRDIHSSLFNDLCKFSIKIESNYCFSKTYSEIESTWSINSSKEESLLSRDSKELFMQRFM